MEKLSWGIETNETNLNIAWSKFIGVFSTAYGTDFHEIEIKIRARTFSIPWLRKWIKNSSKKKEKFYEGVLKQTNLWHKKLKNLFGKTKKTLRNVNLNQILQRWYQKDLQYHKNIFKKWNKPWFSK